MKNSFILLFILFSGICVYSQDQKKSVVGDFNNDGMRDSIVFMLFNSDDRSDMNVDSQKLAIFMGETNHKYCEKNYTIDFDFGNQFYLTSEDSNIIIHYVALKGDCELMVKIGFDTFDECWVRELYGYSSQFRLDVRSDSVTPMDVLWRKKVYQPISAPQSWDSCYSNSEEIEKISLYENYQQMKTYDDFINQRKNLSLYYQTIEELRDEFINCPKTIIGLLTMDDLKSITLKFPISNQSIEPYRAIAKVLQENGRTKETDYILEKLNNVKLEGGI